MNKEEEEVIYPNHDIVAFDDYETMMQSIEHRYEEGDTKVTKTYQWHSWMDVPTVYKMNAEHEWVVWKQHTEWQAYMATAQHLSLKILTDLDHVLMFTIENTDFVIPCINTALLARSRTAKLRVKRVKPAYIERGGREDL